MRPGARRPRSPRTSDGRRGLIRDGVPHEEMRERLEVLNLGRLRVASKGLDRPNPCGNTATPRDSPTRTADLPAPTLVSVDEQRGSAACT